MRNSDAASTVEGPPVRHRRGLPLYIGAGGVATASHYAVTIGCVEALDVMPVIASALGFAVGSVVKYWLNYTVAFRSRAPHGAALARFVAMLAALMAMNTLIFAALQQGLGLHYALAQAITTVLLIPPGYFVNRNWVFR
jgi:putative flippase GtrA